MLRHAELAEIAGRAYSGPQSAEVAFDVRIDFVRRGDELVVAFPGTHPLDPLDWIRDLRAWPWLLPGVGLVHSGFGKGALAAWRAKARDLPRRGLISFTGHSLGGALAQVFACLFRAYYRPEADFRTVTFGAPRIALIGNVLPARLLGSGLGLIEYARAGDAVPHVPLAPLYQHPSRPIVIGISTGEAVADHAIRRYAADLAALNL